MKHLLLALLCLASRASALTVVQTFSFEAGGGHGGAYGHIVASDLRTFSFDEFNPALGNLQSVAITLTSAGRATNTDFNMLSQTRALDTYLVVRNDFIIPSGIAATSGEVPYGGSQNDPAFLSPNASFTMAFDFNITSQAFVTTGLDAFTGTGQRPIYAIVAEHGGDWSVDTSLQHASTLTMIYSYSVPDTSGALNVVACVVFVGAFHRLMRRRITAA